MKKFFCQECGKEVPLNSKSCPNCKKSFESVLCPKCLYSGSNSNFINGCPSCGYLKEKRVKVIKRVKILTIRRFFTLFIPLLIAVLLLLYLLIN